MRRRDRVRAGQPGVQRDEPRLGAEADQRRERDQRLRPAAGRSQRDLMFMRQQDTAVISSPEPLTGPVIYEFVLAHR